MLKEAFYFPLFIFFPQCTSCSSALLQIPSNSQPSVLTVAQPGKTPKLWDILLAGILHTSPVRHPKADGSCGACCILVCWGKFKSWLLWWMCRDLVCFGLHAMLNWNIMVKIYVCAYLFVLYTDTVLSCIYFSPMLLPYLVCCGIVFICFFIVVPQLWLSITGCLLIQFNLLLHISSHIFLIFLPTLVLKTVYFFAVLHK